MQRREILLGDRCIGPYDPVLVVAEIGINHNGSVVEAKKLIDAAAECGVDAVKFQSFRTDHLMARPYVDSSLDSLFQLFRRTELTWKDQEKLKAHADSLGMLFLSTPFDNECVDFLDSLGVSAFKVASADLTHLPLLRHIASKEKPVLLSTGMSYLNEVADAIWTIKSSGVQDIVPMHCVSSYPAPPESLNLRAIQTMHEKFDLPIGYSDHSLGVLFPLLAVALGAVVLEKHFTLDKDAEGPDHGSSMDPADLAELIQRLRSVEAGLGDGRKCPSAAEEENRRNSRRRIVAQVDIRAHEEILPWMLTFKRADHGLEPHQLDRVVGMRARGDIGRDTVLDWDQLSPVGYPDGPHNLGNSRHEDTPEESSRAPAVASESGESNA